MFSGGRRRLTAVENVFKNNYAFSNAVVKFFDIC